MVSTKHFAVKLSKCSLSGFCGYGEILGSLHVGATIFYSSLHPQSLALCLTNKKYYKKYKRENGYLSDHRSYVWPTKGKHSRLSLTCAELGQGYKTEAHTTNLGIFECHKSC